MHRRSRVAVLGIVLAAGACGSDGSSAAPPDGTGPVTSGAPSDSTVVVPTAPAGGGSTVVPSTTAAARAVCPELVMAAADTVVTEAGTAPLAARTFAGTGTQQVTLRAEMDLELAGGDGFTVVDEFDLAVERGESDAAVAPLLLTVEGARPGEVATAGTMPQPPEDSRTAPAVGASICLLHGASGLTTVNSSTERWGVDRIGLLQYVTAAQVVVFPVEPIGAGARWTRQEDVNGDGATEVRRWEYELVSVDDRRYEVRGTATFTSGGPAAAGSAESAQSVPTGGAPAHVAELRFSAEGSFDRPLPAAATVTNTFRQVTPDERYDASGTSTLTITGR